MGKADYFKKGSHNVLCDISGFKVKAEDTVMTWDGRRVRKQSYEPRHPQDFLRSRSEDTSVENPRPEGEDSFLSHGDVTADDL